MAVGLQSVRALSIFFRYYFRPFFVGSSLKCLFPRNRCQVVIKICEDANKLAVDDSVCLECDARLLKVEYRMVILIFFNCTSFYFSKYLVS